MFPRIDLYLELHYVPDPFVTSLDLEKSDNSNGLLLVQIQASLENSLVTGFHQFPKVGQSGITRKKAALSAPYTHPIMSMVLQQPHGSRLPQFSVLELF